MKNEPRNTRARLSARRNAAERSFPSAARAATAPSAPEAGSAGNARFRAKAAHPFGRHNAQPSRPAQPTRSGGCADGNLKENTRILLTPHYANLTARGLVQPRARWSNYHSKRGERARGTGKNPRPRSHAAACSSIRSKHKQGASHASTMAHWIFETTADARAQDSTRNAPTAPLAARPRISRGASAGAAARPGSPRTQQRAASRSSTSCPAAASGARPCRSAAPSPPPRSG